MQKFLGIDVGGTNVKTGVVSAKGDILYEKKHSTRIVRASSNPVRSFLRIVEETLALYPDIQYAGIGLPGTLDKARTQTLELPNIPELNHTRLLQALEESFPNIRFSLENDANAAALGEYHFADQPLPEDYIFVTLGTGVGGAAIIDRKIFKGGDGNSMEIGHMMSHGGKRLEELIGKAGILNMAHEMAPDYPKTKIRFTKTFSSKVLVQAASQHDELALAVFDRLGLLLGEALVSIIRVLDIKHVIIGGGIAASYPYIEERLMHTLTTFLTPYYTEGLRVQPASLGNRAGVLGAASLCYEHSVGAMLDSR